MSSPMRSATSAQGGVLPNGKAKENGFTAHAPGLTISLSSADRLSILSVCSTLARHGVKAASRLNDWIKQVEGAVNVTFSRHCGNLNLPEKRLNSIFNTPIGSPKYRIVQ